MEQPIVEWQGLNNDSFYPSFTYSTPNPVCIPPTETPIREEDSPPRKSNKKSKKANLGPAKQRQHCKIKLYNIIMDGLNNPTFSPILKWLNEGENFQINWEKFVEFYRDRGKSTAHETNIKNRFTRKNNGFKKDEGKLADPGYDTVYYHVNWKTEPPLKRQRISSPQPQYSPTQPSSPSPIHLVQPHSPTQHQQQVFQMQQILSGNGVSPMFHQQNQFLPLHTSVGQHVYHQQQNSFTPIQHMQPMMAMGSLGSLGSPHMGSQSLGSPHMGSQPLGSPHMGSQSLGSPQMGSPHMGSQSLGSPQMGSQSLGSPHMGSQSLGSSHMGSQSLGSPQMGSQSLGSPNMGSQSLGSLGSPHLGSQSLSSLPLGSPTQVSQVLLPQSPLQIKQEDLNAELELGNSINDEDAVHLLLHPTNIMQGEQFMIIDFLRRMCSDKKFSMSQADLNNLAILMRSESSSQQDCVSITLEQFKSFLLRFGPLSQSLAKVRDFVNAGAVKWFHGNITRPESENFLKNSFNKENCTHFLLRSVPIQNGIFLHDTFYIFAVSYILQDGIIYHTRVYTDKFGRLCVPCEMQGETEKKYHSGFLKSLKEYLEDTLVLKIAKPVSSPDFVHLMCEKEGVGHHLYDELNDNGYVQLSIGFQEDR